MNYAEVPVAVSRHGLTVPRLGFGTARIPADQAEHAVRLAIDAGYRLLDTATAYGTEAGIGRAIRKSRVARDQLVVTTKLHRADQGFTPALKAFDRSRRRLGLDAIDLYLIHWPLPMRDLYVETWRALEIIRGRGLAREIGVSNFTDAQLARLIAETGIVPAVNQVELHPGFTQAELRRYHDAHAILTQAWSPLGAGRGLPGTEVVARVGQPFQTGVDRPNDSERDAERCRRSPAQVVLRWHLQLGIIAIPKSVNPDHIRQNIDIFGFALSAADMDELTGIGSGTRLGPDPDSFDPPWESETRRPPGAAARLVGEGLWRSPKRSWKTCAGNTGHPASTAASSWERGWPPRSGVMRPIRSRS